MIKSPDGSFRYSPSDLVAYLEGDFAAWCERLQVEVRAQSGALPGVPVLTPDRSEDLELVARKGQEHEDRYLARMRLAHPDLVEIARGSITANADTAQAMRTGASVIYQAHLAVGDWHGYPDFLVRGAGPSALGDFHYVPWDTKLARSAKPYFLVQLCAYAELLETLQGRRPAEMVFVLGDGEEPTFATDDYFYYYLQLKRSFLAFQAEWRSDRMPDPGLDRSWGQWSEAAAQIFEASDHLSRVANITRGQTKRLEESGVTSMAALAAHDGARVPHVTPAVLDRLQLQARLQITSRGADRPTWELRQPLVDDPRRGLALLPPPSALDVFFDMEGFPFAEGGLEYLFGATTVEAGPEFHDWWAHDGPKEKRAFEGFIDWVVERWRRDRSMHIYHYASYEASTLKRLMGQYATREAEVDDLLRHDVLVDLFTVVRQGLVIGTPSYSLKDIERLYLPPRSAAVTSAGGSVLEYQRWLDSGEPQQWERSPILQGIREYNRVDCESTWQLRDWLLDRQRTHAIAYIPSALGAEGEPDPGEITPPTGAEVLAARLLARCAAEPEGDPEWLRVTQLLAWLVEFHRREEKPMWWRMFDRHEMTHEQLHDSLDCLAGLERTDTPPRPVKRSTACEYLFDADQDTKLRVGSKCFVAGHGNDLNCTIVALDAGVGLVELLIGPKKALPDRLSLIPNESVGAEVIKDAVFRYAAAWEKGEVVSRAVDDMLARRAPRARGHLSGDLLAPSWRLPDVIALAQGLEGTTLCIQGPPGTGKTFTAAAIIADLLAHGKRVAIAANSHKVILNLMRAVAEAAAAASSQTQAAFYKVGDEADDPLVASGAVTLLESKAVVGVVGAGPILVGGTAWVFSRPELQGCFDYLFIDEAGQVSLANAVAMGLAATNLILVGDQMQLAHPTQGTHPGETGLSCLEYVLHGHATVPPDRGVFLGISYRMHEDVCRFISDAIYEGRLTSAPATEQHRVFRGADTSVVPAETGVVFVPVEHEGCTQCSDEEVDVIERIVGELLQRTVTDRRGGPRPMTPNDILLVAPFNMQVRRLRDRLARLGAGIRIGSVDRFQGQEAPVVIVSLCASALDEAPRGAEFLLDPNRLNVAVSRAEALAIVVGSPALLTARCRSVAEMKLVNLLCRLAQYDASARVSESV